MPEELLKYENVSMSGFRKITLYEDGTIEVKQDSFTGGPVYDTNFDPFGEQGLTKETGEVPENEIPDADGLEPPADSSLLDTLFGHLIHGEQHILDGAELERRTWYDGQESAAAELASEMETLAEEYAAERELESAG